MSLLKLIPNVFYADMKVGLHFFVDQLGFKLVWTDPDSGDFCIVKRDHVTIYLCLNEEVAKQDRPQIRIETDDIESYYQEIKDRNPEALHPNSKKITSKPWGMREFAALDETHVCVVISQPDKDL